MNSRLEAQTLTEPYRRAGLELEFWNEPSNFRSDELADDYAPGFEAYVASAHAFFERQYRGDSVLLMGHSFGFYPALSVCDAYTDKIAGLVLITPASDCDAADRQICTLCLKDFRAAGHPQATVLAKLLDAGTRLIPDHLEAVIAALTSNPGLTPRYFRTRETLEQFAKIMKQPRHRLDVEALLSVRLNQPPLARQPRTVPTLVVFGGEDMITNPEQQRPACSQLFSDVRFEQLPNERHYPHVEDCDGVLALVLAWWRDVSSRSPAANKR